MINTPFSNDNLDEIYHKTDNKGEWMLFNYYISPSQYFTITIDNGDSDSKIKLKDVQGNYLITTR